MAERWQNYMACERNKYFSSSIDNLSPINKLIIRISTTSSCSGMLTPSFPTTARVQMTTEKELFMTHPRRLANPGMLEAVTDGRLCTSVGTLLWLMFDVKAIKTKQIKLWIFKPTHETLLTRCRPFGKKQRKSNEIYPKVKVMMRTVT
uniref:Uncharacterized protein n=1 Tax=Oryza sativa subsp. japonica TaxID=39947 RepID=Q60F26_ORYSJ|nr:hypothetical protein [Oryza sativa Japonica Group]